MTPREELEALRRMAELETKERAAVNPAGDSFMGNLSAAAGMGVAKMGRAAGQAFGLYSQDELDEANRLDKPLENAPGGTTGRVLGQVAAGAVASRIPGANSYLGAALLGGGTGALTTEGGVANRAAGAAFGATGGVAGKALGDVIGTGAGWLVNKLRSEGATEAAKNAGRDAAAAAARKEGLVIPPADTKPGIVDQVLGGVSGKVKTAQEASARNQPVINELAARAVGAPAGQPLSIDALNAIRKQAGQAYDAVATTGNVTPGPQYAAALDKIVQPYVTAAKSFPGGKPPPAVLAEIESLRTGQFDAGSAVSKIRMLRESADAAYSGGDKAAGKALKDGAKALEDALEEHVKGLGAPGLLKGFKDARTLIAKTYSVQSGLNDTTGDVAASALTRQLVRNKPLNGELETIARAGQAFPKATQMLKEAPGSISPLDAGVALAGSAATGNPMAALSLGVRPVVRNMLLSKAYQGTMTPQYGPNRLQELLLEAAQSPLATNALIGAGITQPARSGR